MNKLIKILLIVVGVLVAIWVISTVISTFIVKDTIDETKVSAAKSEAESVVTKIRKNCMISAQKGEDLCTSSEAVISNISKIANIPSNSIVLDLDYDKETFSVKSMTFQSDKIIIIYDGNTYNVK